MYRALSYCLLSMLWFFWGDLVVLCSDMKDGTVLDFP